MKSVVAVVEWIRLSPTSDLFDTSEAEKKNNAV